MLISIELTPKQVAYIYCSLRSSLEDLTEAGAEDPDIVFIPGYPGTIVVAELKQIVDVLGQYRRMIEIER